uniref:Peptidase_S9 domain-containing protein n=1 Tax=Heterorhabditis bacteriophora TaxID=37862 RepID=A0A1I7XH41_HETBA
MFILLFLPWVSTTLISRDLLFSDDKYSSCSLSPDGRFIGYIAPDNNGIKNVFTKCVSCKYTRQVTFERDSAVLSYSWTGVPDIILYTQDNNGDENTMLFKKNVSQAAISDNPRERFAISDRPGVKALIIANNHRDSRVLVGLNDQISTLVEKCKNTSKQRKFHNIYSFDLLTNKMTLIMNNKRFPMFVVDHDLNIRLASEEQPDASTIFFRASPNANSELLTSDTSNWVEYLKVQPDDKPITIPVAFDKENKYMYWIWGDENIDLGMLVTFPFDNPEHKEVLYTSTKAQIGNILFHPEDKSLLAVTEIYHKPELFVANETVIEDLQYLVNLRPHASLQILSLSRDMNTWLITYLSSDKPFEVFLYRRWVKKAELLFNTHPELENYRLNKQIGFDFQARDNMIIQAYLSLPPQTRLRSPVEVPLADKGYAELGMIPARPQKMIVMVHGGPKARDSYGFSPMNAWLTNRGYAVLQVNFRGSIGFGKKLVNAGNGEWGRKMHFDLLDAVEFTVAKGIANRSQVAIMGGSYGGYATLVGLTFTPDIFACGVDIVGPSNLISLLEAVPPYWTGFYQDLVKMVGADINTESGRQSLTSRSPLFFADRVKKPIIILQGANDPRVKQRESDQFVHALQNNSIPVTYILYPDEGHGFRKPGQYNSTAILKSDGFLSHDVDVTSSQRPTFAPRIFYRPVTTRSQPSFESAPHLRPSKSVISRIFPQYV